jgi:chemotaxis protein MotB
MNQLKSSLKPLAEADFVTIETDQRGLVIRLSADYLFESGAVTIDPQVLSTLDEIGRVLGKYPDKYVEVQGHTDSTPITTMPFADNWALASARADNVVRYLAGQTPIEPSHIKSVAIAQYRPTEDRKMLRRVEIIFSPLP